MSPESAVRKFQELSATRYDWYANNCLTRSFTTLRAYSSALHGGTSGAGVTPTVAFKVIVSSNRWEGPARL